MNDKRKRITIELRGQEQIAGTIRSLDIVSSFPGISRNLKYNLLKVIMQIDYQCHKNKMCDADEQGEDCAFRYNLKEFKENFKKEIEKDIDFAEGGEDYGVLQMFT